MSKFVCSECGLSLATKHSLQRHQGTNKCKKVKRDRMKEAVIKPVPRPSKDYSMQELFMKPLHNNKPSGTIFRKHISIREAMTTFRKRNHTWKLKDIRTEFSHVDSPGRMMLDMRIKVTDPQVESIVIWYGGVIVLSMSLEALRIVHSCHSDLYGNGGEGYHVQRMLFGNQALPLDKICIMLVHESGAECKEKQLYGEVHAELYQPIKEEAHRFDRTHMDMGYTSWQEFNVLRSDGGDLHTTDTLAYVADVIYSTASHELINPDFRGKHSRTKLFIGDSSNTYCSYSSVPDLYRTTTLDNVFYASLIPPGERLFRQETDDIVIVRYHSVLQIAEGEAYAHNDLYSLDSRIKRQRFVRDCLAKRLEDPLDTPKSSWNSPDMDGMDGMLVPVERTFRKTHIMVGGKLEEVNLPECFSPTPTGKHYPIYVPIWGLLGTDGHVPDKSLLDRIVEFCENDQYHGCGVADHAVLGDTDIAGRPYPEGMKAYYFRVDSEYYGFTTLDLRYHDEYKVPIPMKLYEKMDEYFAVIDGD